MEHDKQSNNQHAVINVTGYTTKSISGRNYLIVPAVPVKEQVMNTYLVPAKELEFAQIWNGTPITIRHPSLNNGSVNVPEPDVAVIGRFFNGQWDGENKRVTGEYWIDVDEALRYTEGQYIVQSIYSNKVLETSTGYWADEEPVGGEFNGRKYSTVHRNLKPDHIAILVDAIGACSVADGCGVNRNSLVHKLWENECLFTQGGVGSGNFGHGGRPGQVGGASGGAKVDAKGKDTGEKKTLKKQEEAYYVVSQDDANKYRRGYKGKVSLMSKAKAQKLYESMDRGGFKPVILQVRLSKGTEYSNLTSSSITVGGFDSTAVHEISFDSLTRKSGGTFSNIQADCGCPKMNLNQQENSLSDTIESIRKCFYDQFIEPTYNLYIKEIFDGYCIVSMGDKLWKAEYTTTDGNVEFTPQEKWTEVAIEYVEQKDSTPATDAMVNDNVQAVQINVVAPSAPAEVKRIFERVYTDTLKKVNGDKAKAAKIAWGAVHKAGWMQDKTGKWMKSKGGDAGKGEKMMSKKNSNKEKNMKKITFGNVLELLRGKGVDVQLNNEDEVQNLELELEEEEETPVGTPAVTSQNAQQFTAEEMAALKKLLTVNFDGISKLASQLPTVMEMAQNAEAEKATRKAELVGLIINSQSNTFTKEELEAMSLPVLTKMNAQMNVNYAGIGGGMVYTNVADDEVLGLPSISMGKE